MAQSGFDTWSECFAPVSEDHGHPKLLEMMQNCNVGLYTSSDFILCAFCVLLVSAIHISKIGAMVLIFLYDWNHLYRFDVEMFFLSTLTGKGVSLHGAYCISFARKILQI